MLAARALGLTALLVWAACQGPGDLGPADQTPVALAPGVPFAVPARTAWPTDVWPTMAPADAGLDVAALARLEAHAFDRHGTEDDRRGQRTNALLIVHRGAIVYERYARGHDRDTPVLTWSVSKSLAATLIGVAVREGRLDLGAPACRYYPPLCRGRHGDIRVTDLLRMSSGLDFRETYEGAPFFSSVIGMLYGRGRGDMAAFAAALDLAHAPGTHWRYSSGDTLLLMAALARTMPADEYARYPWRALFDRIGMTSVTWERDSAGTFVGSSYLYATPRDLARWAQLMLADGVWDGERILPEGWVRYMLTVAPAFYRTPLGPAHRDSNPGAQVHLNAGDPARDLPRPWPEAPPDTFAASGHWGKAIFVIPSLDLIAVRMGDDREYACDYEGEQGCVTDPARAYGKRDFLRRLMDVVAPVAEAVGAETRAASPEPEEVAP